MTNCEDCIHFKEHCLLPYNFGTPQFHDGWCDSFDDGTNESRRIANKKKYMEVRNDNNGSN